MSENPTYNPAEIEPKWQKIWDERETFKAEDNSKKKKTYLLVEFPYPSGDGLHVGHPRSYTALDVIARKRRQQGENVLYPMGWDAFGLPTENYAIKTGQHPRVVTDKNIANFRRQMKMLGLSFDWSREVDTTDPKYYRWTQWIFLQLLKAGLAYQAEMAINWCPKDKIGLANEEVIGGKCERCGTQVTRKLQKQWMLKITAYADRLLKDLDTVDYLPQIKQQQVNWIGRSEGAEILFPLPNGGNLIPRVREVIGISFAERLEGAAVGATSPKEPIVGIRVFTTRPDTLFGATYLVLAPEHPLVETITTLDQRTAVEDYVKKSAAKSDLERTELNKEKTGVFTGAYAVNPINKEKIPVWVADYVLASYGTGAIMAVPAHDERDFAFAKKFDLPVKVVIEPITGEPKNDEEFRRSIVAIVLNKVGDKVLTINWGSKNGGRLFVGGGREASEEIIACAQREIAEETGYTDISQIAQTEVIHHHYFAHSKNVQRNIEAVGVLWTLQSEKQVSAALEANEIGKFSVEWVSLGQAEEEVKDPLHAYVFQKLVRQKPFQGQGIICNSGAYDGLNSLEAKTKIVQALEQRGVGKPAVQYKLRDWVFSRQHYWGEPIPVVHCPKDGVVPIPEKDLPLELPHVEKYEPTDTGESPLASITDWVNTMCPKCKGPAKRETDTMPNWAGSSWYFLRYTDPHNTKAFADKKKLKYWTPVDIYNGGNEHTTLHLLYSRFWHKFLYDQGFVPTAEPYIHRHSHGLILAEDGRKMSKSWGNVVNPDDIVAKFGADTLRTYEMFLGPFEEAIPWSTNGLIGVRRFLDKVWRLQFKAESTQTSEDVTRLLHQTIQKVTDEIEGFRFNTAVSALMILTNALEKETTLHRPTYSTLVQLLMPFAPHLAAEIFEQLGQKNAPWPKADAKLAAAGEIEFVVQVAGKRRDTVKLAVGATEADVLAAALRSDKVTAFLRGQPSKVIFVPKRLINLIP